ncbi:MAG TPA: NADH oxidase [Chloroflexi bacterium]|nr:NADH oxidase [Chloroflexota bacterium]
MTERLIVVGGVAAGMSAASKAKRANPNLDVVVYEKSLFISYGACGMPYLIAGDVADYRDLLARTPEQMAKRGVKVHVRHEVMAIDAGARTVTVRDLAQGRTFTQAYDKLVVATGAAPIRPPVPGVDLEGVCVLRSLEDGRALLRLIEERRPQRAVIVGGGYIGLEMAETFRRLGMATTMMIRSGQVMRQTLDDDVRVVVEDELARCDVTVVQGTLTGFEGDGWVEAALTDEGRYPCDVALLGIGVRPVVELARQVGVRLGKTGAIATDHHMRTNLPGVYAAGDCAEVHHLLTGEPAYIPLGSTANKQGRTAGAHAAGDDASFAGVVGTLIVRVFDLAVASTGLTSAAARSRGYAVAETNIQAQDVSHYFPGAADIHVKLIVDEDTERLLGGQIVGRPSAIKRIDVLATALHHGLTVSDLQRLDLSYAPPFAPVWDPLLVAANVAGR